jgi:hypothetical protein
MTNLHSNSLPATSCELPASLQLSALSRACHAHNRVCYRDSRLMTQTAVLVMQTAVSICSVLRDLLCCRVCQHWLSPKESNRCVKSPLGDPPSPLPPCHPAHPSATTGPTVIPTRNPGLPALVPARPRQFAGPNSIPKPPPSLPRPALIPSHTQTLASGSWTAQWHGALAVCHGVNLPSPGGTDLCG